MGAGQQSRGELADVLATFAQRCTYESLPSTTVEHIKLLVRDQLAVTLAGSSAEGIDRISQLIVSWGGAPQATIATVREKVPVHHAAFVNSAMARARDFDAVHERAILHACAGSIPALLAIAERDGRTDGRQLIAAIAVAMESMIRLLLGIRTNFLETGRIASAHCTSFATALGAAKLLGLPHEAMVSALGIAGSQVSGSMQPFVEGSELVRIQQGWIAQSGVFAALLAEAGTVGTRGVFDGSYGYFRCYHEGKYDRAVIEADLGSRFHLEDISLKFYPCCFLVHSAVEGVLALKKEHGFTADDVESVRVLTTTGTYNTTCAPAEAKKQPRTAKEALFSMPFALAVALRDGEVRASHFTDTALSDPSTLRMAARIDTAVDAELDRAFPVGVAPSTVLVALRGGRRLGKRVDCVKGNPRNRMTQAELQQKIVDCNGLAARPLSSGGLDRLVTMSGELEKMPAVDALARSLVED